MSIYTCTSRVHSSLTPRPVCSGIDRTEGTFFEPLNSPWTVLLTSCLGSQGEVRGQQEYAGIEEPTAANHEGHRRLPLDTGSSSRTCPTSERGAGQQPSTLAQDYRLAYTARYVVDHDAVLSQGPWPPMKPWCAWVCECRCRGR